VLLSTWKIEDSGMEKGSMIGICRGTRIPSPQGVRPECLVLVRTDLLPER
jgi:hypothetical protein